MAEDEAQDMRNALEDRGMLQLNGTGRIVLANRYNPEAEYDALEAAAEALDEDAQLVGRPDPEQPGATRTAESLGVEDGDLSGETLGDLDGRTPPGARPDSLEHLRDASLRGKIVDMDSLGENIVADPSGDYTLEDSARASGDRFFDDETVVLGSTSTFADEEVAPRSTRPDDGPYEADGINER